MQTDRCQGQGQPRDTPWAVWWLMAHTVQGSSVRRRPAITALIAEQNWSLRVDNNHNYKWASVLNNDGYQCADILLIPEWPQKCNPILRIQPWAFWGPTMRGRRPPMETTIGYGAGGKRVIFKKVYRSLALKRHAWYAAHNPVKPWKKTSSFIYITPIYMSGTILGAGNPEMKKLTRSLPSWNLHSSLGRLIINKINK